MIWYCKRCFAKSEDSQEGREELVAASCFSLILPHHFHTWLFPMGGFFHRYPAQIIFHQNARTLFCQNELASCTAKYFCARQNNPVTQKLSKSKGRCHLRFSGIRPLRGYPPPTPLTENQSEKKKVFSLGERGGTPPPLTESPLSFSGKFFPKRAKNDVFFIK